MRDIFKIKLDLNEVKDFISAANSIPNDINLTQRNALASGKSIMGIYALNLGEPVNLIVHDRTDDEIVFEKFGRWIIND